MTIDDIGLKSLRVLLAVAEEGGFSAAGRRLGLQRATVSRIIGRLEAQLGARLCRRSTRNVVLTSAGQDLVARLGSDLPGIVEALEEIGAAEAAVSGLVRISVSQAFGRNFVLDALRPLLDRHPALRIELLMGDHIDNLVRDPVDLAIRIGPLPDSTLVARKLGSMRLALVVAPGVFVAPDRPVRADDLEGLATIGFRVPGTGEIYAWPIATPDGAEAFRPSPPPRLVCNSVEAVVDLALRGFGAAIAPDYLVRADVAAGRLHEITLEAPLPSTSVHVCYASRDLMPRRTAVTLDHLLQTLTPGAGKGG